MNDHICKYGTETRTTPVESYNELLDQEGEYRDDDGKVVPLPHCETCTEHKGYAPPHEECPRAQPICADCSVGVLVWAEGGYVPWHRICSHCGSHWDLNPKWPDGSYRRARFYS